MDFERRLSEVVHELADADPPADLVSRTVARLSGRSRRHASFVSSPSPLAVAAIIAALALVVLAVASVWRSTPLPPAQEPSPTATGRPAPSGTPAECPAALIEGTLVEARPGAIALMEAFTIEPVSATPIVIEITWEPAYFSIVEEDGVPAVADPSGRVLARVGDHVQIGGGQRGAGWYACGSLELIWSPPPSPSPVIDADDPEAWEVLVALERELGRIGRIRQLERSSGGALTLEVTFPGNEHATSDVDRALSGLGLRGEVTIDEGRDGGFVRVRLEPRTAVALPTPTLGCGARLEMYYRIDVFDEARLVDAQHAAARALEGRVIRTLADRFEVHAAPHQDGQVLVVLTGNYGPVDEGPFHESLAGPVAVEFLLAPPDSNPQAPPTGADRLFGGSRVASARPTVDRSGRAAVEVVLTGEGASALDVVLPDQMGHYLVITLDGTVLSAATINASGFDGELLLTGDFTVSEAVQIARALAAGADQIEVIPEEWQLTQVDC